MKPTMELDMTEWLRARKELSQYVRKESVESLWDEVRRFVSDCIKLTPPRGKKALDQTYGDQRKKGQKAVKKDIGNAFRPFDKTKLATNDEHLSKSIRKYIREQNFGALETIIKDLGLPETRVILEASEAVHAEIRNQKTGRLLKGKFFDVLRVQSIGRLLKLKLSHIGKAKAGWMKAARMLGVKRIPNWISQHNSPGLFEDNTKNPLNPNITVGNLVSYIQEAGANKRVMQEALRSRTIAINARITRILVAAAKKHSAA